jgi:small ligand-binding sensory domain FIST
MTMLTLPPFRSAAATAPRWQDAAGAVLRELGRPDPAHNLGFLYVTDFHAADLQEILIFLRRTTGIGNWVGAVGLGVVGSGVEYFDRPALSVLITALPNDGFALFADPAELGPGGGVSSVAPVLIAHADPATPELTRTIAELARRSDGFLIGGLSASRGADAQIAGQVLSGGVSGVAIALEGQPMVTGISQGCMPIGPVREVTRSIRNVVLELDGHPALDMFRGDIGVGPGEDLASAAGRIFAGLVEPGDDPGQGGYLVRNLVGIDIDNRALAIGDLLPRDAGLVFCRRDRQAAVADMRRMLEDLRRRAGGRQPKGGLYVSCAARGPNQFAGAESETALIREVFGDMPLTGFFANGEISRDRLYAYTGVLTLFL